MSKTVLTRNDLSEFENIRLHNIANMYVNIREDDGTAKATAYLAAQLKQFTVQDVEPFVEAVLYERGMIDAITDR